eukprot:6184812-Alexandrium_andersonii.AAC.1
MWLDAPHSSVAAAVLRTLGTSWVVLEDLHRECTRREWLSSQDLLQAVRPEHSSSGASRLFP